MGRQQSPGHSSRRCRFPVSLTSEFAHGSIANAVIHRQALEDSLRAAMIRTAYSDVNLSPLPDGCTFTLTIEMRDEHIRPGNVSTPSQLGDFDLANG
jgi:hypothetical protein